MLHFGKIFTAVCGMILSVCLVFSITALTSLRNAISETDSVRKRTEALLEQLRETESNVARAVQAIPQNPPKEPEQEKEAEIPQDDAVSVDILYQPFEIREKDGKIAVFSEDGYLLRTLNVPVSTLPAADRDALANGIRVTSWRELQALIEDFGG